MAATFRERDQKIEVLVRYWEESLQKSRILQKLLYKEKNSTKVKLSDKEQKLKMFLQGQSNELQNLGVDSTTRKYGELAVLQRDQLLMFINAYIDNLIS